MKPILLLGLLSFVSCGLRVDFLGSGGERISGGGVVTTPTPTPDPIPPVGGECVGYSLGEAGVGPSVSANFSGSLATFTKIDNLPGTSDEYLAGSLPSVTGKTYYEATLVSSSQSDNESYYTLAAALTNQSLVLRVLVSLGNQLVIIHRYDNDGDGTNTSTTAVFNGRSIAPGYTIGVQIDHDSGVIKVKDSIGEVGTITIPEFAGQSLLFGTSSVPGAQNGSTMEVDFNAGMELYRLTPFAGSQDFCGNPL